MPRNASGEIKTRIVRQQQKNGDIYVLERKTQYDPDKKYNRVISTTLINKIPKGSSEPVPTRPKRSKKSSIPVIDPAPADSSNKLSAVRRRTGMMDIVDAIGKASGIDDAVYAHTDIGTAQKIISLARYLFCTDGQSLPGITAWQYTHPLPYKEGISEDVYHRLFTEVGLDESLQQNFFRDRYEKVGASAGIAYDSTTYSTYSEDQIEARYGFNKAGDGLKTIKYLALYSLESRQPIAFTKQAGDLPDVVTVGNALQQLLSIGVKSAEVITDNGYYSESNLSELFHRHFDFITLSKPNIKWIRPEIDRHASELDRLSSVCPYDHKTHGITVMTMHEFTRVRERASKKSGLSRGDEETFSRKMYIHIFFNAERKVDEDHCFEKELLSLKSSIESGTAVSDFNDAAQKKIAKYLILRTWGSKTTVLFNEKACAAAKKYHGYFVLIASREKDTFEALRKYRKREHIEDYFRSSKQHADSMRVRVWDPDTLRGRMFVQFVALCYYEYLSEQVRKMKATLGIPNGDPLHDLKKNLDLESKLKSWLDNTPLYLQMQWFDVIETVEISTALRTRRFSTEATLRDQLYLDRLGVVKA